MIDPKLPVRLKKMVICPRSGDAYITRNRPYQPGELPERFLTDEYCIQADQLALPASKSEKTVDLRIVAADRPAAKSVSFNPQVIGRDAQIALGLPDQAKVVAEPASQDTLPAVSEADVAATRLPVKINVDDAFSDLGLPDKVVAKIKSERAKKPFADIADLRRRVPGSLWENFAARIEF